MLEYQEYEFLKLSRGLSIVVWIFMESDDVTTKCCGFVDPPSYFHNIGCGKL